MLKRKKQEKTLDHFFTKRTKSACSDTSLSVECETILNSDIQAEIGAVTVPCMTNSETFQEEKEVIKKHPTQDLFMPLDKTSSSCPPTDIAQKGMSPCQPNLHFPVTGNRKFSNHWYKSFLWLEYSIIRDAVFCHSCRLFGTVTPKTKNTFTVTGFRDWKKIGDKCKKHEVSFEHKMACENQKMISILEKTGTIDQQLDANFYNERFINDNKKHLLVLLDVILLCARQDIALRGDNEAEGSLNTGNFLEILKLLSKYNADLQNRLENIPRNAKMTSAEIQNDLLISAKDVLLENIKREIQASKYYSILADEVKDVSKKQILGVSIRFVSDGKLRERAVGLVSLPDQTAKQIAEHIEEILKSMNLNPLDCVGFGFDGANVMAGNDGGVQAILRNGEYTRARYFHCASHRLNLALSEAATRNTAVRSFFDTLDKLHTFMTGSKRHAIFIEVQKSMNPKSQPSELCHSSNVRWSSRSTEVARVMKLLNCILCTLSVLQGDNNCDTRLEAQSLLLSMETKKFVSLLVYFSDIYSYSEFATKGLQDMTTTVDHTIALIEDFKIYMKDLKFENILRKMDILTEELEIVNFDSISDRNRQRKLPAKLKDTYIYEQLGCSSHVSSEKEIRILLRNITDDLVGELNHRFGDEQYNVMKAVEYLIPSHKDFLNINLLEPLLSHLHLNISEAEIKVFKSFTATQNKELFTVMDVLNEINKNIFPILHELYTVILTIPQTLCAVERMFSYVKHIKTRIRSRMTTARLNNLALLSIEKELTIKLDSEKILKKFKEIKKRRLAF